MKKTMTLKDFLKWFEARAHLFERHVDGGIRKRRPTKVTHRYYCPLQALTGEPFDYDAVACNMGLPSNMIMDAADTPVWALANIPGAVFIRRRMLKAMGVKEQA